MCELDFRKFCLYFWGEIEDIFINPLKYIDFIPKKIGRWWNNNMEIDIVAFDDENIAFIECKWQNSVNKEKIKNELIVKSSQIQSDKKRTFIVISKDDYLSEE